MADMHSCRTIDGKKIAASIRAATIELLSAGGGSSKPVILTVSIGNDPSVESYARQKEKAAASTGIEFRRAHFGAESDEDGVLDLLRKSANDANVSAILIHTPVPQKFDFDRLSAAIPPEKDVDCLTRVSRGMLFSGKPLFAPATAEAVIEILKHEHTVTSKKHVVIIGRSLTVGKPLASLLLMRGQYADATVTLCHSATDDIAKYTRQADILVAAAGRAHLVTGEMIRSGATVIDVGINPLPVQGSERRQGITGDVDFDSAFPIAGAMTPVPGGVGPVTSAVLMRNVARAWLKGISRRRPDRISSAEDRD